MSQIPRQLTAYLDEHAVAYEVIPHRRDYTAQETAHHTHTPGREFAKTVVLWIDGSYALAALPAHHHVDVAHLRQTLGAQEIKLATEEEMRDLCSDCEPGAVPPFGNLYNLPVYVSEDLAANESITFNAGNHTNAIRMRYADFARLVEPQTIALSKQVAA